MARFLIRRIVLGIFVLWMVTVVVFLIFYVGPGRADVARTLAGRAATPQQSRMCRTGCCSTGRSSCSTATSCGCSCTATWATTTTMTSR